MYFDLLGDEGIGASPERVVTFTTTVIKSYRRVAYHNATHAFMVAHSMYNILKRNAGMFSRLEVGTAEAEEAGDEGIGGRSEVYRLVCRRDFGTCISMSLPRHRYSIPLLIANLRRYLAIPTDETWDDTFDLKTTQILGYRRYR